MMIILHFQFQHCLVARAQYQKVIRYGKHMFRLPFIALIFSYPCPGGGRKNGDTIGLLSVWTKIRNTD